MNGQSSDVAELIGGTRRGQECKSKQEHAQNTILLQVQGACSKARTYVEKTDTSAVRGQWGSTGLRTAILGVAPEELDRVHYGLDNLDRTYGEQLAKFVGLLPSADHVDLRFLLFRLEAGGTGRATEDGNRLHVEEDTFT